MPRSARAQVDNPRVPLDGLLSSLRPGGRDFERLCKWALENVPEYRQRLRQVWLWDDALILGHPVRG